jgi:hypothetical protein
VVFNIWIKRWQKWMNKQNNNIVVPQVDIGFVNHPIEARVFTVKHFSSLNDKTTVLEL